MEQLTQDELRNLLVITKRAQITGEEAMGVAMLQQKLANLIKPVEPKKEEKK